MRLEPVSKDFNAKAAQKYVEFAKKYPEEAEYVIKMFAAAELERIMDEHGEEIVAEVFSKNYEILKKSLARGIANGTMSNDAVDATVEAVEFAKKYNPRFEESQVKRDKKGRFSRVRYTKSNGLLGTSQSPVAPGSNGPLAGNTKWGREYQEAALMLTRVLSDAEARGRKVEGVEFAFGGNEPTQIRDVDPDEPDFGIVARDVLDQNDFVGEGRRVDAIRPIFADSKPSDEFTFGDKSVNVYDKVPDSYKDMGDDPRYRSGTNQNLERVGQAGKFLNATGLSTVVPHGETVAMGAKFIGDYGPMADKVMEPGVRRAFYRYQGSEQKPDKSMLQAMSVDTRGATDPGEARDRMFVPRMETTVTPKGYEETPVPSKFLRYWQSRLPDAELLNLHTSSGAIPPSEGLIIDKNGKPVVQAVGMHDDHYLPFNLKRMNKAKGGEYIRTRALGGLTSEDIDGGIIGGANAVTVVSHSGIFTMELNRAGNTPLKKARRVRMRRRYEQLVDSLAAGKVQLDAIPPDREAELRAQVEEMMPGDTSGVQRQRSARLKELQQLEKENPTPSAKKRDEWTDEFLFAQGEKWSDKDGQALGVDQLRSEVQLKAGRRLESDADVIAELGLEKEYDDFMRYKKHEYTSKLGPLKTNGEGYYKALKALKEQFPYDIKDVRWTPPDAQSVGANRTDAGYVKAKHLRSDDVLTGFWDPEIDGYVNPGGRNEKNLKGTGKRRASMDNFSGARAREKLGDDWYKPKDGERAPLVDGGGDSFSSATTGGVSITNSGVGPAYQGFGRMEGGRTVQLTPYQEVNQMLKIRRALKTMGPLAYIKTEGSGKEKATFNPWDSDNTNDLAQDYSNLFSPMGDDEFQSKLANDEGFRASVKGEIQQIYTNGRKSDRGIAAPLARHLQEKKLFNGLVIDPGTEAPVGTPQPPKTALGLISTLESGEPTEYDFTQGYMDGSLYLPGLTRREYRQAWKADPDISTFAATSEKRFGTELSMDVDNRKVARVVQEFGRAMREGLDQAQEWKGQIAAAGSPSQVKNQTIVRYGGKNYSVFAAQELEEDISRDALAVAKIKQLRAVIGNAKETDTDAQGIREISLQELKDRKEQGIKDPDDVPDLKTKQPINQVKLESARNNLDKLVGLDEVKEEFESLVDDAMVSRQRAAAGLPVTDKTMHLVFTGNPGTGKTTVAQEIGRAYNALGLIPNDKVVVATRADLVGQYAGHTAAKTRKKFNEAKGGVLFIDEAYSLVNSDDDSFGFEAVDEIVSQSENNRDDTVVIMAGYPGDMDRFMGSNPGLKSRFPRTIDFPDYSATDLNQINTRGLKSDKYEYAPGADKVMQDVALKITQSPHYSNARDGRNFRDLMLRVQGQRVAREYGDKATRDELSLITPQDVEQAKNLYFKQRTGSKRLAAV